MYPRIIERQTLCVRSVSILLALDLRLIFFKIILILFLSIIIPFTFSFHPKIKFNRRFHIAICSILIVSIPFIIWDMIFVKNGIWGFNKNHISGFYIYNLPIEELLFFFIIPFCCVYTHHLIEKFELSFFKINNWKKIN